MHRISKRKIKKALFSIAFIVIFAFLVGFDKTAITNQFGEETGNTINTIIEIFIGETEPENQPTVTDISSLEDIPEWDKETAYVVINNNVPTFTDEEKQNTEPFESYSKLDYLGRCGTAYANVCKETMPTDPRESITSVKPTGWINNIYDCVDGGYLYNRCHLIGFQLTGENANDRNLITGTRFLNIEGMLVFENMIDDYVEETDNHVLYRVTPVYDGENLLCSGIQLEAWSVEDNGEGICFNVYSYNAQPGVEINYATGDNWAA